MSADEDEGWGDNLFTYVPVVLFCQISAVFQRAHRNNHTPELARRTRATANYYKETRSPTGALRTGSRT